MPFMQRLQSAMILKTSLHHMYETNIVEHPEKKVYGAIERNDVKTLQQKIMHGYDVDLKSSHHIPSLIYATIHNRVDCIDLLIKNGANINITDKDGRTPLHFAVNLCSYELIYLYTRLGADINARDENDLSPLEYAKSFKDDKALKILKTTQPVERFSDNIFACVKNAKLQDLAHIVHSKLQFFEKNSSNQTLLHVAVLTEDIRLMNYLYNKGLDVDAKDANLNTPLLYAIINSASLHVIDYLCKKGASIDVKNAKNESPLLLAIRNGYDEIAEYLIENGANVNITEGVNTTLTLCHYAIHTFEKSVESFRRIQTKLIAKGATVDISINKLGWTPLMHCCTQKESPMIKDHFEILIQLGANLDKMDINGRNALMLAASVGNKHFVQRIIDNYADIDQTDNFGWNALIFAVYYAHKNTAKELLISGIDVNTATKAGQTALQIATQQQNEAIISLLKDYGAYANKE